MVLLLDYLSSIMKLIKNGIGLYIIYFGTIVYNNNPDLTIPIELNAYLICFLIGSFILSRSY